MYEEYLEFAVGLARQAGAIQMESFRGGDLGVEAKSNLYDVVTRVDKACEALIAEAGGVVESLRDNRGVSIAAGNSHMVETMRKFVR